MSGLVPSSEEELAEALREAVAQGKTISALGNGSKQAVGGPVLPAAVAFSTKGLRRILCYEPRDLTISVEAGLSFSELQKTVSQCGQMVALDPPFSARATVGGVVATNGSGPMRRGFGTARDLIIGMTFALLDGRLVKTGGMVVKNVAGLDMGKLLIGSFGTLGIMTSINFRLHPIPRESRTFAYSFSSLEAAVEKRDWILRSVLMPVAVDLLSTEVSQKLDRKGITLLIRATGSPAVLGRYARELEGAEEIPSAGHAAIWRSIREFTPEFIRRSAEGAILRISSPLNQIGNVIRTASGACICRAASGVTYVYLSSWSEALRLWNAAAASGWSMVVEYAPTEVRETAELWRLPLSGPGAAAFDMMKQVKRMFDPDGLLNRLRLYGRI